MFGAVLEAQGLIVNISLTIDPPKTENIGFNDALTALGAGLAFLAVPDSLGLGSIWNPAATIFTKALQQAPTVTKLLYPPITKDQVHFNTAQMSGRLAELAKALGMRIESALQEVQGGSRANISNFLAFTQYGDFSKPRGQGPSISNTTEGLLIGFSNMLVTKALTSAGWNAVVAVDTNPLEMTLKPNALYPYWVKYTSRPGHQFRSLACHSYDAHGLCDDSCWWYSRSQDSAYTLTKQSDFTIVNPRESIERDPDPRQLLKTIFDNGWSTGELLFQDTSLCSPIAKGATARCNEGGLEVKRTISNHLLAVLLERHPVILKSRIGDAFKDLNALEIEEIRKHEYPHTLNKTIYDEVFASPDSDQWTDRNSPADFLIGNIDLACTSQLNLTILDSWTKVWYMHRWNFTQGPGFVPDPSAQGACPNA